MRTMTIKVRNNKNEECKLIFKEVKTASNEAYGCGVDIQVDYECNEKITKNYARFDMRYNYCDFQYELDNFAYWYVCCKWYGFEVKYDKGE